MWISSFAEKTPSQVTSFELKRESNAFKNDFKQENVEAKI